MILIVRSKKAGRMVFQRPGKGQVFMSRDAATLGPRIVKGGGLKRGEPISYGGSCPLEFERICRKWARQYNAASQ